MNNYMKTANNLANENLKTNNGGPFGACVVKDGEIIGKSANMVLKNNDPTAHAEIMAIRNACKRINSYDLSDCEIYTTCYPCPMCLSAIIWSNIKKVYYSNSPLEAAKIGFKDQMIYDYLENKDENIVSLIHIDEIENKLTFKKYSEKKDKTIY